MSVVTRKVLASQKNERSAATTRTLGKISLTLTKVCFGEVAGRAAKKKKREEETAPRVGYSSYLIESVSGAKRDTLSITIDWKNGARRRQSKRILVLSRDVTSRFLKLFSESCDINSRCASRVFEPVVARLDSKRFIKADAAADLTRISRTNLVFHRLAAYLFISAVASAASLPSVS